MSYGFVIDEKKQTKPYTWFAIKLLGRFHDNSKNKGPSNKDDSNYQKRNLDFWVLEMKKSGKPLLNYQTLLKNKGDIGFYASLTKEIAIIVAKNGYYYSMPEKAIKPAL